MSRAVRYTLLVVAAACTGARNDGVAFRPLAIGSSVPSYTARTLAGDSVHIGGAGEPTVLNIWATWCTSCREEMAALDSLKASYASHGVRVIAVSVDDGSTERVRRFAESNHLAMTVAHDPSATIEQSYQIVGVPTTFVVGRDGKLVWRHTGNVTGMLPEVRSAIDKALR
jgi:peroxiredoxin